MKDNPQLQHDDLPIWLALKYKFERLHVSNTPCRPSSIRLRDQDDPHDYAHPEGENSAKRQKTSEYGTYVSGESSSGQVHESKPGPTTLGNQEQLDDFDFWTDSYATDDDEPSTEKVLQELVEEISQTVDEAKLHKVIDEMLRQRCTSTDEHPCHKDPKAPALSLVNQDLLYLKKGNSEPEKIVLSLHKFHAVIFPNDDIEERTSRWKQKELGKLKEVDYSNSKIVQIIKTYWELGHEHKFITEIIVRRANGSIVSLTESDYKNLNKNDSEDLYLLIVNGKLDDYAETRLLWSLSVFIRSAHGYVTPSLSKEDAEYLQLFEEEIEERLKYRAQMRRWEIAGVEVIANIPEEEHEGHPLDQPITWLGSSPKEATWEEFSEFQTTYPFYLLEDKVNFKGEESVTPVLQEDGRPE
ncbi:hypothetical protein Tco_0946298 [Tanacetum coccineum]